MKHVKQLQKQQKLLTKQNFDKNNYLTVTQKVGFITQKHFS
jgi:hypothetical protein